MPELPTPGGDDNIWGGELNTFLLVSLNADGTLQLLDGGDTVTVPLTLGNATPEIGLSLLPVGESFQSASLGTGRTWSLAVGANAGQGGLLVAYTSVDGEQFILTPPGSGSYTITLNGLTTASIPFNDNVTQVQTAVQLLGPSYSVVNVYNNSFGQIIITTGSLGTPTASGATITAKLALNAFEVVDQEGNLIYTVGDLVTSYAGMYVGLGTLVDQLHQMGWWNDVSGGAGTHGYTFFNKWGSAPFDVGGQPQFHGNALEVLGLASPTLSAFASSAASTLSHGTYYYVATAVNNAGQETIVGNEVSITTSSGSPSVQLAAHQVWGMANPNFYRGTVSGGPYQLIGSGTETPQTHGSVAASVGLLDNGLSGGAAPPTAPTPNAVVLQGWAGEPSANVAFSITDSTNASWLSITRHGAINTIQAIATQNKMSAGLGLDITGIGHGVAVAEGTNGMQGAVTLSGGTATVANTNVNGFSRIMLTAQALGTVTTPQALAVTARTNGTSFTITSASASDTSVVAYEIFQPG